MKAPGSKRLKLEDEKMLSNFAFKFNLRRYIQVDKMIEIFSTLNKSTEETAGAYTRPLLSSTLRLVSSTLGGFSSVSQD